MMSFFWATNFLQHDKILDFHIELKHLQTTKYVLVKKLNLFWGRVENNMGKRENAGNQYFSPFFTMFFFTFKIKFWFLSPIYFVVCKCFQFGPVQKFVVW